MQSTDHHLSDQDLMLAADGELPAREAHRVQAHLARCWTCRARMHETERVIAEFIHTRETAAPSLPSAEGPRALLKLRLAQLAHSSPTTLRQRTAALLQWRSMALACSVSLSLLIGSLAWRSLQPFHAPPHRVTGLMIHAVPDPRLTPGATLPLTRDDVCAAGMTTVARVVPVDIAKRVFAAYGVTRPEPRAWEVDYLITPALGGSDNIRNFWPQPYGNTVWNAHIKDALEDHLRQLVCEGTVDLATAQREIAADWIGAYKKYFRTEVPLPEHSAFLADRPWE